MPLAFVPEGAGRRTAEPASVAEPSAAQASGGGSEPDIDVVLTATQARVPILLGDLTNVWQYQATIVKGSADSIRSMPDSYLGPTFRVRKGQRVRVRFANRLPDARQVSIIHWHGLHLPEDMDGHPRYAIRPGEEYVYDLDVVDRAGTYWYHPHPDMLTGPQVYMGLAGLFIVSDDEESQLALPSGDQDVPLVIQDRTFDRGNQLVYLDTGMGGMHGMSDMMGRMMGFLGRQVLVNGQPEYTLDAATRAYRLRLLNGSNSRVYKLAWGDGSPLTIIGTDGGLLAAPVQRPYVMLAPGERVELWADWSGRSVGDEITLESLAFEGAEGGGMSDMMMGGSSAPPLGSPMTLMTVRLVRHEEEDLVLPRTLSSIPGASLDDAVNRDSPRQFELTLRGMQWLINGRTFQMHEVAEDEVVQLNTTEVWEFVNARNPGAMMDSDGMVHPFHVHGVRFRIIGRSVLPSLQPGWDTVKDGYVDEGWKDTVMIMPGERVRLLVRFADHKGDFVYHCHNLEHEDAGMMRNYRVRA